MSQVPCTTTSPTRRWIPVARVATASVLVMLASCDRSGGTSTPTATRPTAPATVAVLVDALGQPPSGQGDHVDPSAAVRPEDPEHPLSQHPIYDLEVEMIDLHGATIGLDVWRGPPTIVAMFYASCPVACPRLMREILEIEASLPHEQRDSLRVLMVSFDASNDTPAVLTELAATHKVDLTRWQLAAAPEARARELAAVLGVKYRTLDDGQFFHTSVITLIDGAGRPLARVEGLGRSTEPLRQSLASARP